MGIKFSSRHRNGTSFTARLMVRTARRFRGRGGRLGSDDFSEDALLFLKRETHFAGWHRGFGGDDLAAVRVGHIEH